MVELGLVVDLNPDNTFEVLAWIFDLDFVAKSAVLKLDYNYVPWPRHNGNLLWQ